jgi:uncharacterized protein
MLRQQIQADQIVALKSGDKKKLEVLRYILAQIKYKEIEKKTELSDEEVIAVLRKQVKELTESIESFQKGNRADLVADHQQQVDIVASYMPAEMSNEELKKEIDKVIADNQAVYQKNAKVIIGVCVKTLRDKADPARISKILQQMGI